MSYRYWIAAIALGLALLGPAAIAAFGQTLETPPEQQSQEASANQPEGATQQKYSHDDPGVSQNWIQRFFKAEDTVAQWAMAVFAFIATGVSVYAIVLLRGTLEATRDAARFAADTLKEAEKATAAANLTVNETRRIGEAQVRAYLTIKEVSVSFERNGISDKTLYMKITVSAKNSGASPARDFVFNASVLKIMGENPEQFSEGGDVAPRGFGEDIAPDEQLSTSIGINGIPITEAEIFDLEIMDIQLYARIDARFFDVFDNGPLQLSGNYAARITKNSLRQPNVMRKTPIPPEAIFAVRQEARQSN